MTSLTGRPVWWGNCGRTTTGCPARPRSPCWGCTRTKRTPLGGPPPWGCSWPAMTAPVPRSPKDVGRARSRCHEGTISKVVARGNLGRPPDGGVLRSAVLQRLASPALTVADSTPRRFRLGSAWSALSAGPGLSAATPHAHGSRGGWEFAFVVPWTPLVRRTRSVFGGRRQRSRRSGPARRGSQGRRAVRSASW